MFGNKKKKMNRFLQIEEILQQANGITQADLARKVSVTRSTINKDLAVIQEKAGVLVWEDDDGRLYLMEE